MNYAWIPITQLPPTTTTSNMNGAKDHADNSTFGHINLHKKRKAAETPLEQGKILQNDHNRKRQRLCYSQVLESVKSRGCSVNASSFHSGDLFEAERHDVQMEEEEHLLPDGSYMTKNELQDPNRISIVRKLNNVKLFRNLGVFSP